MTFTGWAQIALYCLIIVALVRPLGGYMTRLFAGDRMFLTPVLGPIERGLYRAAGVDERGEQHWATYALAMLAFNLARDFMHQNQWAAAIEELQADGLEDFLVPGTMPLDRVRMDQAHVFWNCSAGTESGQGRWAQGPAPDGRGQFEYFADPRPLTADVGLAPQPNPLLHGTAKQPTPPLSSGPNPLANGRDGQGQHSILDAAVDRLIENQ
jgi:Mn-containing catalase